MSARIEVPKMLVRAGWRWTTAGVEVTMHTAEGRPMTVLVPLGDVEMIFRQSLASVGAPMWPTVGAPGTTHGFLKTVGGMCAAAQPRPAVGGFFKKLGRRLKKIGKGIFKAVKKVGNVVKKVVTHPAFRAAFAAVATAFPVLAPAAAGLEVASRVISKVDKGIAAAKKLKAMVPSKRKSAKGRKLKAAANAAKKAQQGIASMRQLAQQGDRNAQRAMGALVGARAILR